MNAPLDPGHALGIFDGHGDVGDSPRPGKLEHEGGVYRVTGGGANIWNEQDAFHFAWKRLSGDVDLQAAFELIGKGVEPHRKVVLMLRQDLSPGSAYADVCVHGDGLTSLQFRSHAGAPTREIRSPITGPRRVRIERREQRVTIFAGGSDGRWVATGPQFVELRGQIYVGIGVCSHNADVLETAIFTELSLDRPKPSMQNYLSHIAIYDLSSRTSRVVHRGEGVIEAPNWSRDGKFLLVNTRGDLFRLPLGTSTGAKLEKIQLGAGGYVCNNDHDLSADGKLLAFSASSPASPKSQVFVSDASGANVRLITPVAPSYFHGWSPDSRYLAFVAERGDGRYELYRVPAAGGAEERLTSVGGYDDGPEYSPDGRWIYFNSNRGGRWNIWRIPPHGAGPKDVKAEQVTNDTPEDWFPHISPDGKAMVFLSFPTGTEGHNDKMPGMQLRLIATPGKSATAAEVEVLEEFYGGQGTLNVNSWSPDSKQFAYVIYEPVA